MGSRMSLRPHPVSVRVCSTLGGTSAYTLRVSRPLSSISRSWAVSTFWVMWADGLFQLAEAPGAVHQLPQDQYLPFVADEHQGGLDWAGGQFHDKTSNSILLVTTARSGNSRKMLILQALSVLQILFYTIFTPISILFIPRNELEYRRGMFFLEHPLFIYPCRR